MILEPPKIKSDAVSTVSPSISHEVVLGSKKGKREGKKPHNKMLICCRFDVIEKKGWTSCDLLELKIMIIQPLGNFVNAFSSYFFEWMPKVILMWNFCLFMSLWGEGTNSLHWSVYIHTNISKNSGDVLLSLADDIQILYLIK